MSMDDENENEQWFTSEFGQWFFAVSKGVAVRGICGLVCFLWKLAKPPKRPPKQPPKPKRPKRPRKQKKW